ncbi:hypothetical protein ACE6H2_026090 [Prunus campanulata]
MAWHAKFVSRFIGQWVSRVDVYSISFHISIVQPLKQLKAFRKSFGRLNYNYVMFS